MPSKESTSKKGKQRPPRRADGGSRQAAKTEKPPESAEDFEHTLRRLISARGANRRSDDRI